MEEVYGSIKVQNSVCAAAFAGASSVRGARLEAAFGDLENFPWLEQTCLSNFENESIGPGSRSFLPRVHFGSEVWPFRPVPIKNRAIWRRILLR